MTVTLVVVVGVVLFARLVRRAVGAALVPQAALAGDPAERPSRSP